MVTASADDAGLSTGSRWRHEFDMIHHVIGDRPEAHLGGSLLAFRYLNPFTFNLVPKCLAPYFS